MELMKLGDSRKRYNILLGKKGDFMYDIETTLKIFEDKIDHDSFSLGQLESKKWAASLMEDLFTVKKLDYGTVFVLCGWYGILPAIMFYSKIPLLKIRSFDIDPSCEKIADFMNKTNYDIQWKFKAVTQDIYDINFEEHLWQCWSNKNDRMSYPIADKPDTIINTSCEHTDAKWFDKIPKGKIVVLQSNDSFSEKGHINAMVDLDEFRTIYPMDTEYYAGSMTFEKYTRFMLVGVK
ncbi:MAG: hypothetical protein ACTSX1_13820 [Candidatus Heimdallarchaeaceae archaeon]